MLFSKVESETQVARLTQSTQDQYEVNVRAANIVSCLIEYSHEYVNNIMIVWVSVIVRRTV